MLCSSVESFAGAFWQSNAPKVTKPVSTAVVLQTKIRLRCQQRSPHTNTRRHLLHISPEMKRSNPKPREHKQRRAAFRWPAPVPRPSVAAAAAASATAACAFVVYFPAVAPMPHAARLSRSVGEGQPRCMDGGTRHTDRRVLGLV